MLTLYGHPFSRAHRVMWMLKELDVPFDHVPTDFVHGGTHQPEFLSLNPNGRVPVLMDDGLTLIESLAINLYLARKFGGPLAPSGLAEETAVTQWSFWVVTEIEKPLLLAAANSLLFAPHERRPHELSLALEKLNRPFAVLNAHLSSRPFLVNDRFTVADLNVAAVMSLVPLAGIPLDGHPHLSDWLHRCLERPAAADWKPIRFTIPRPATDAGLLKMFV